MRPNVERIWPVMERPEGKVTCLMVVDFSYQCSAAKGLGGLTSAHDRAIAVHTWDTFRPDRVDFIYCLMNAVLLCIMPLTGRAPSNSRIIVFVQR